MLLKKILISVFIIGITSCLMTPVKVLAAVGTVDPKTGDINITTPITQQTIELNVPISGLSKKIGLGYALEDYIKAWYGFVVGTVAILATVMIMWAGFKWLTSRGNASIIGDAKDIIWSSIIGLLLAFLSYTILQLINPSLTTIKMPALDDIKFTPPTTQNGQPQTPATPNNAPTVTDKEQQKINQLIKDRGGITTADPKEFAAYLAKQGPLDEETGILSADYVKEANDFYDGISQLVTKDQYYFFYYEAIVDPKFDAQRFLSNHGIGIPKGYHVADFGYQSKGGKYKFHAIGIEKN